MVDNEECESKLNVSHEKVMYALTIQIAGNRYY